MPENANYGYDLRINANLNRMLSSSFSGHRNYMRKLSELMGDAEAMKDCGNKGVVWDFHARRPLQVLEVPGAALEIRWALAPDAEYAFTSTALTSKLWGIFRLSDGSFEATEIGTIGDPAKTPLPVDSSLSRDDKTLFVDSFMDGMVRVYDVSNPRKARQIYELKLASQVNRVSQSWDGTGHPDEQFVKAFRWDARITCISVSAASGVRRQRRAPRDQPDCPVRAARDFGSRRALACTRAGRARARLFRVPEL